MIGVSPTALAYAAAGYATIGFVVAVAFLLVGLDRLHPAARGRWTFRPMLLPGLTLLWPYVLRRWRRGAAEPTAIATQRLQRRRHAQIWFAIAVLPPLILLAGLALRQASVADAPPLLLAPPS